MNKENEMLIANWRRFTEERDLDMMSSLMDINDDAFGVILTLASSGFYVGFSGLENVLFKEAHRRLSNSNPGVKP